jgi:hypothetical protein
VADYLNLDANEVSQVMEIARGMKDLEDAERLYPLYLEELRANFVGRTAGGTWDKVAISLKDRYLESTNKDDSTIPVNVKREINVDVSIVSSVIDYIVRGDDSDPRFYTVFHKDKKRTIVGVCPGVDLARKWISTATEVIKRARTEHPELF